jgi:hypothetical protein
MALLACSFKRIRGVVFLNPVPLLTPLGQHITKRYVIPSDSYL